MVKNLIKAFLLPYLDQLKTESVLPYGFRDLNLKKVAK